MMSIISLKIFFILVDQRLPIKSLQKKISDNMRGEKIFYRGNFQLMMSITSLKIFIILVDQRLLIKSLQKKILRETLRGGKIFYRGSFQLVMPGRVIFSGDM